MNSGEYHKFGFDGIVGDFNVAIFRFKGVLDNAAIEKELLVDKFSENFETFNNDWRRCFRLHFIENGLDKVLVGLHRYKV